MFRRNECADLDVPEAGGYQCPDDLEPLFHGEHPGLVLQPVARADVLDDERFVAHAMTPSALSCSISSSR